MANENQVTTPQVTFMSDETEKQKIREVISTWMRASADGDTERVIGLMLKMWCSWFLAGHR